MKNYNVTIEGRVAVVTLDRPAAMNALNSQIMTDMTAELQTLDRNSDIGCILLTGSDRVFAAGADIAELAARGYQQMFDEDFLSGWEAFVQLKTPKIAAVAGYALGGGCELAMMCDIIYAADNARFGQPEIKLGLIPGMGGSQRLTRLVGKAKAMDMILTGRMIEAEEAERAGLVARVFPTEDLLPETLKIALTVASYGDTALRVARDAVNMAEQSGISDGLLFERRTYHALWATDDAKEGMQAFIEKRPPVFRHSNPVKHAAE